MDRGKKKSKAVAITRRKFLKAAGVAGLASTIGLPAVIGRAQPKEILIGSLHPITGPTAYDGLSIADGFQLAIDHKNAAGGIKSMGGAKMKVILMDTESKPKVGESAAEKMIRDGCIALAGCYNSPVTMIATQVAERNAIPFLVTISVADEILERGFKYTFRTQPDSSNMAELTCKYTRQLVDQFKINLKTLSHLYISGFGTSIFNKVQKFASRYGFDIIGGVSYGFGVSDFTTEISKIKAMNSDVIFDTGYLADGILKLKTYADLKVEPKGGIIGCSNGAYSNPTTVKELGRLTEYILDGNYYYNPRSPLAKRVIEDFGKRFTDVRFQSHSVHAYDAALVLVDALERAASADPKKLRDAIASISLKEHVSPGGPIEFDATGQNKNAMITLQQIQKRDIKLVLPEEYSDAKPVYPIPPWSART
jgi:branched-chain amino acid transport system substrate-binding protein